MPATRRSELSPHTRNRSSQLSQSSRAPATGYAATEAPRGLLYHRYRLEEDGTIAGARIVPPTPQNQATIEEDLKGFVEGFLDLPDDELRQRCERTLRNYDPCISCAAHFLRFEIDRG
jgi:sulfhydrogenase subunit alpha